MYLFLELGPTDSTPLAITLFFYDPSETKWTIETVITRNSRTPSVNWWDEGSDHFICHFMDQSNNNEDSIDTKYCVLYPSKKTIEKKIIIVKSRHFVDNGPKVSTILGDMFTKHLWTSHPHSRTDILTSFGVASQGQVTEEKTTRIGQILSSSDSTSTSLLLLHDHNNI